MSFGFSVSDIYGCARLAYVLYEEFKQAPGACQDFARELRLFHQVLLKTNSTIQAGKSHLSHADETALESCLDSCRELLYVRIMGAATAPRHLDKIKAWGCDPKAEFFLHSTSDEKRFLRGLRQKLGERKFASRIPELQRAVSAHVEKLTASNVLIVQSSQRGIQASQKRIEESIGESRDLLTKSTDNHVLRFESLSSRLETSQSRIEAQLQAILTNQQRTGSPILSHSLDASSPEGRETWMELGRLLRDEGITPAMIRKHRELLVNAMKSTLEAESVPQSYATAPEYNLNNSSLCVTNSRNSSHREFASAFSSVNLFGSAPRRSAGFTDAFLERQSSVPNSLSQKGNVDDGMRSLLQGMNGDDSGKGNRDDGMDDIELEDVGLNVENLELKADSRDEDAFDKEIHQNRALKHVVKPLVPTPERGESSRSREAESAATISKVPSQEANVPIERGPIKEYWQRTMSSYHNNIQRTEIGFQDASVNVLPTELGPPSESIQIAVPNNRCTCKHSDILWAPTHESMSWQDMGYRYRQRLSEYERDHICFLGKGRSTG